MNLQARARAHAALGEPIRLAILDDLVLGDSSPGELSARFALATNLLAFHLRVLDDAGLVRRVRSEGDGRRQYVQLRLDDPAVCALTRPAPGPVTTPDPSAPSPTAAATAATAGAGAAARRVVFVCTANSARSQLAAAAWRRVSSLPVSSAGTHPAARVHPRAIEAARRHGLDLTRAVPTSLTGLPGLPVVTGAPDGELSAGTDEPLLVAVCDNAHEELTRGLRSEEPPGSTEHRRQVRASLRWLHWHIPDPVRVDTGDAFEAAYAQITERVDRLAAALAPAPTDDLPAVS